MAKQQMFRTKDETILGADGKPMKFRLSFPHLHEARAAPGSTTKKFGANLIAPVGADVPHLKKLVGEVVKGQWPEQGVERFKKELIRSPILDGNKPKWEDKPELVGSFFIRPGAGEEYRPKCFKRVGGALTEVPIKNDQDPDFTIKNVFYAGCKVYVVLNAFAWHNQSADPKDGISFGLVHVLFAEDGERLGGGGSDPHKHFESIVDNDAPAGAAAGGETADDMFG